MTDTTPGCGSTTDARKRLAEQAGSRPDDREVPLADWLRDWRLHGCAHLDWTQTCSPCLRDLILTSDWLAEHDAQVRAETLDVCAALLDRVVTYWGGRPLSAGHGVNLYADVRDVLRGMERDRDHNRAIARQSVEGGA